MAKYNREFLVPYLQSVCALELAQNKLNKKDEELQYQVRFVQNGYRNPRPEQQAEYVLFNFETCLMLFMGILFVGLACWLGSLNKYSYYFLRLFFAAMVCSSAIIAVGFFAKAIQLIKDNVENNRRAQEKFRKDMDHYQAVKKKNDAMKRTLFPLQLEAEKCKAELKNAQKTLTHVYSENIIPSHYRNIYVAIYLYDWFSTSQLDDLDAALSMYVLEEIKDRLDTIIRNQSEMILNQYMMLSNQQKSLEQQEAHGRMMRGKLDQMIATEQERNAYLGMIEGNTRATAYFAAADYIRKI